MLYASWSALPLLCLCELFPQLCNHQVAAALTAPACAGLQARPSNSAWQLLTNCIAPHRSHPACSAMFAMPQRRNENLFYSFDVGPLHVLVYNTGGPQQACTAGVPAANRAGRQLVRALEGAAWQLACCHGRLDVRTAPWPRKLAVHLAAVGQPELFAACKWQAAPCCLGVLCSAAAAPAPAEVFFWPHLFSEDHMRAQYEWMEADLKAREGMAAPGSACCALLWPI